MLHDALPRPAVADSRNNLLAERMRFLGGKKDRFKPFFRQNLSPLLRRQTGVAWQTYRRVLVQPPSLQQAEGQMIEQGPRADLVEQQDALVLQRRFGIAQGFPDIRRRM